MYNFIRLDFATHAYCRLSSIFTEINRSLKRKELYKLLNLADPAFCLFK